MSEVKPTTITLCVTPSDKIDPDQFLGQIRHAMSEIPDLPATDIKSKPRHGSIDFTITIQGDTVAANMKARGAVMRQLDKKLLLDHLKDGPSF